MRGETVSRVILITGCGSGLGLAIARRLSATAYRVVITARRQALDVLKSTFKETENLWLRNLDVTDEAAVDTLINEITVKLGGVDVLINNAGVCYRSVIEHMDKDSELQQINTNYLGPMSLIRAVVPIMREKRTGHIINISSVSAMVAMPTMSSYSASKAALEGATEALWYEMRPFGIHVSLVQPGFIHSHSYKNTRFSKKSQISLEVDGPYSEFYRDMAPFIETLMTKSKSTPDAISKKIFSLINDPNPPLSVPVTRDAVVFGFLRRVLPRFLFHKIMFRFLPGSSNWGQKKRIY